MGSKKLFTTALKALLSIALLSWVFYKVGVGQIIGQLLKADKLLFLSGIFLFALSNILGTLQWWLLLRLQGIRITPKAALYYYFVGLFFNNFLPTNIGGDVYKAYDLSKRVKKREGVIAATIMDRLMGFVALVALALLATVLAIGKLEQLRLLGLTLASLFILLSIFLVFFNRRVARVGNRFFFRFLPSGLRGTLKEIYSSIYSFKGDSGFFFKFLGLSLIIQSIRILINYLIALSIGIRIDFLYFFLIIPLIALAIALPISVAGIGVRESSGMILFQRVGVIPSQAASMQLLTYIVTLLVGMIGGILFALVEPKGMIAEDIPQKAIREGG